MRLERAWVLMGVLSAVLLGCGGDDTEDGTSGSSSATGPGSGGGSTGPGGGGGAGAAGGSGGMGSGGMGSGGMGSGGMGSGGMGSGGMGSGGMGSGGMGSGGMNGGTPQCTDASDCTIVNDCCTCAALGPGEQAPPCPIQCLIPKCAELGFPNPAAQCVVGQCVAGFPCDHNQVACDALPPNCPAGQTASVNGLCWGPCVEADECAQVGSCAQCSGGQACVTEVSKIGPIPHCVDVDPSCGGTASCACMGGAVCVGSFDACSDANGEISCSCPSC